LVSPWDSLRDLGLEYGSDSNTLPKCPEHSKGGNTTLRREPSSRDGSHKRLEDPQLNHGFPSRTKTLGSYLLPCATTERQSGYIIGD
jgi:hypothetical protein